MNISMIWFFFSLLQLCILSLSHCAVCYSVRRSITSPQPLSVLSIHSGALLLPVTFWSPFCLINSWSVFTFHQTCHRFQGISTEQSTLWYPPQCLACPWSSYFSRLMCSDCITHWSVNCMRRADHICSIQCLAHSKCSIFIQTDWMKEWLSIPYSNVPFLPACFQTPL